MNEQIRPNHERLGRGGGLGSIFDGDSAGDPPVTVTSGIHREDLPLGNNSVGEIRRRLRDRLDIDPHATAILDGHEVGDDVVVRPGQALMFSRRLGEKGA